MTWQGWNVRIERFWRALAGIQLLLAIIVFVWYGWEEKRLNSDVQQKDIALRQREAELRVVEMDTLRKTMETMSVAIGAIKKTDSYLIGGEILKIIFAPDRECLTEDQYMVIDFLAELYNKTAETPAPREMFLNVMRQRPACLKKMPIVVSTATEGYVVIGSAKYSCTDCPTRRVIDFSNFAVLSSLDRTTIIGKLPPGAIVKAKININLRANTTDIELGGNPVLRSLEAGQCALVKESFAQLRGNTWAAVTLGDCPA